MATLYELTNDFLQVQQMIEDGSEGLDDTLESIEAAIEDKLEGVGKVIKNLEGETTALKAEEKRLAEKRKTIENKIKRLKEYAQDSMLSVGERKVQTPLFTFGIQNNPPSIQIVDEQLIPKNFYRVPDPQLDKKTIIEKLKNGERVPGTELTQTESVRIR